MRRVALLLMIVGLAAITVLVLSEGVGAVWHALAAIGWWGFALVCLSHLALIGLMGLSWQTLMPGARRTLTASPHHPRPRRESRSENGITLAARLQRPLQHYLPFRDIAMISWSKRYLIYWPASWLHTRLQSP